MKCKNLKIFWGLRPRTPAAAHSAGRHLARASRSLLGGAPLILARTHCPNIYWAKIMARQKFLAALFAEYMHAIQTFLQPTAMHISRRTKLNFQRGQAQCPEGLNAMPRGAIINARGAKRNAQRGHYQCSRGQTQYPEGTNNAQRGQTQSPEG